MMIGTLVVSLCPVALPLLGGMLLSPRDTNRTSRNQLLGWPRLAASNPRRMEGRQISRDLALSAETVGSRHVSGRQLPA